MSNSQKIKDKDNCALFDELMNTIEGFIEKISDELQSMDIEELLKIYEEDIDNLILKKERDEMLSYVGGEFKITYMDESYFSLKLTLVPDCFLLAH